MRKNAPSIHFQADGCHIWRGAITGAGYGAVKWRGKTCLAHRVAFEKEVGPLEEGDILHHVCGEKRCVNVSHLEVTTRAAHVHEIHKEDGATQAYVTAMKARTHCAGGHEYTAENTKVSPEGWRRCRICARDRRRERYRAKKGEMA